MSYGVEQLYFFGISLRIKRSMRDTGKKQRFKFCEMFENVQFFLHLHFKFAKSAGSNWEWEHQVQLDLTFK
jgi:hypothetical protein